MLSLDMSIVSIGQSILEGLQRHHKMPPNIPCSMETYKQIQIKEGLRGISSWTGHLLQLHAWETSWMQHL
jgi:hypothetical protein